LQEFFRVFPLDLRTLRARRFIERSDLSHATSPDRPPKWAWKESTALLQPDPTTRMPEPISGPGVAIAQEVDGAHMFYVLVPVMGRGDQAQRCAVVLVQCRIVEPIGQEDIGGKGVIESQGVAITVEAGEADPACRGMRFDQFGETCLHLSE
jgi:hypothetical protein